MSTRYHMLPSQILANATTLDLLVLDKAARIQEHHKNGTKPVSALSVEKMQEMVEYAKKKNNER